MAPASQVKFEEKIGAKSICTFTTLQSNTPQHILKPPQNKKQRLSSTELILGFIRL